MKPDYILIFETPDPAKSLAMSFWVKADDASEPQVIDTCNVDALVKTFQRKGYTGYQNSKPNFKQVVLIRRGFDHDKARELAQSFMYKLADGLLADVENHKKYGGSSDEPIRA